MPANNKIIGTFWLIAAALPVAFAWLIPNHYVPWLTFHTDTMMACGLTLIGAWVVRSTMREQCDWHWPAVLAGLLALIPISQYLAGMIPFFGVAWINSAYLIGLLLALLVGARWERASPSQCLDFLFLAIGVGALISVYLALHQLLRLDSLGDWIMRMKPARPGANLAQPNQLASFFVLALLASCWGYLRERISATVALCAGCFFLLGVAITLSRTGWMNVFLVLTALLLWGRSLKSAKVMWAAVGLGVFFVICVLGIPVIIDILMFESNYISDDRFLTGLRPIAWRLFIDAAQRQPTWGFGWGQLAVAQFQVAADHPDIGVLFYQSHNLFLDLVLWNGLPLGLTVSALIIWWVVASACRIRGAMTALPMLFLMVLGVHAMLEYPLHYAYFLLPTGLVVGVCSVRLRFAPAFVTRPWTAIAVLVLATSVLAITIADYLRVETSFYALRFEKAHVGTAKIGQPPEVLVLTQLREMIRLARVEPLAKFNKKELNWMRAVVETTPSNYGINKLAIALAYNGQPQEARLWLERLCKTSPVEQCTSMKKAWIAQTKKGPAFAAVDWPGAAFASP